MIEKRKPNSGCIMEYDISADRFLPDLMRDSSTSRSDWFIIDAIFIRGSVIRSTYCLTVGVVLPKFSTPDTWNTGEHGLVDPYRAENKKEHLATQTVCLDAHDVVETLDDIDRPCRYYLRSRCDKEGTIVGCHEHPLQLMRIQDPLNGHLDLEIEKKSQIENYGVRQEEVCLIINRTCPDHEFPYLGGIEFLPPYVSKVASHANQLLGRKKCLLPDLKMCKWKVLRILQADHNNGLST